MRWIYFWLMMLVPIFYAGITGYVYKRLALCELLGEKLADVVIELANQLEGHEQKLEELGIGVDDHEKRLDSLEADTW